MSSWLNECMNEKMSESMNKCQQVNLKTVWIILMLLKMINVIFMTLSQTDQHKFPLQSL